MFCAIWYHFIDRRHLLIEFKTRKKKPRKKSAFISRSSKNIEFFLCVWKCAIKNRIYDKLKQSSERILYENYYSIVFAVNISPRTSSRTLRQSVPINFVYFFFLWICWLDSVCVNVNALNEQDKLYQHNKIRRKAQKKNIIKTVNSSKFFLPLCYILLSIQYMWCVSLHIFVEIFLFFFFVSYLFANRNY